MANFSLKPDPEEVITLVSKECYIKTIKIKPLSELRQTHLTMIIKQTNCWTTGRMFNQVEMNLKRHLIWKF